MPPVDQNELKELRLSNFTLDNLQEAVIWIASDGQILQVNEKTCELSGFSKSELTRMNFQQLNASQTVSDFQTHWQQLKDAGHLVYESKHKHKSGYSYDVEVRGNFIEIEGLEFSCSIVTDIRKKKLEQELLRTVSEYTAAYTGEDFFNELTRYVSATLNVRYALISECSNDDKTKVRTLSYVDHQELRENIEYDLEGTPCEIVMKGKDYFCASALEKQFPREKDISSYVAVPIYSPSTKEVIGHIAAFDKSPMTNAQNQADILRIFAARAGSEIERIKTQQKLSEAMQAVNVELQQRLKESEQRYRDLFEEAPIAYVHEGLDSRFIKANRAALRILGVKPEEVPATYGKTLVVDNPENQKRLKEAFSSIEKGVDTGGVVLELRRKDNGKPIWIQWWSKPDPGGQFTRTMFIDITEQVLMEKEQAVLKAENLYLQEEIKLNHNFQDIISISKKFQKVLLQIEQVAETDVTVLITGESGTGKELIARAVHNISNRRKKPLVKVNCAALPAHLIESELFGHERGAFTGAMERKIGRFELADGGTIFLDEIGELPVELQAKLLRVLQEGEFERLGNPKTMKVSVRIIAATNRNLEEAIEKKQFREDLYYRLNVFPIALPPLRERKEDIPFLVKHFCQKHETKVGKKVTTIPSKVMDALTAYNWPGNIRELENIIERALILSRNETIEHGDWMPMAKQVVTSKNRLLRLDDVEKEHIIEVLKQTNWKVSGEKGAAKILGLNATTLEARMKKLGIKREQTA
jgi:formate hydrogenlyase transcriptional activator